MKMQPGRLRFPEDEKRQPWLPLLLEIQHITNQGVAAAIKADGRKLACGRGCASCCRTHTDIPVYPLELMGIAWYATEKLEGAMGNTVRNRVRDQLLQHRDLGACPFLVDEACTIHPLRPMACRQFNVFNTVCAPGEDAFHTRLGDVLRPDVKLKNEALREMLRHHNVKDGRERRRLVESGEVHRLAQSLREMRWETLATRLAAQTKPAGY